MQSVFAPSSSSLGFTLRNARSNGTCEQVVRPLPPRGQSWHTFLHNHTVWASDFLLVYDVWFRPIFAFFIVDMNTKRVVHVGVTRHPTAQWRVPQMREATPFGVGPELIIRDNDGKFGADFDRAAKGAGIRVLRTAVQAPLVNSVCARFLGSVRRECVAQSKSLASGTSSTC